MAALTNRTLERRKSRLLTSCGIEASARRRSIGKAAAMTCFTECFSTRFVNAHARERNGAFEGRNSIRARPSRSFVHRVHIRANRGYTLCNQATNTYPISRAHTVGNSWGKRGSIISMCNFRFIIPSECAPTSLSLSLSLSLFFLFGKRQSLIAEIYLFQFQLLIFRIYASHEIIPILFIFFVLNVCTSCIGRKCVRGYYCLIIYPIFGEGQFQQSR